jgi:hypothetical protein
MKTDPKQLLNSQEFIGVLKEEYFRRLASWRAHRLTVSIKRQCQESIWLNRITASGNATRRVSWKIRSYREILIGI